MSRYLKCETLTGEWWYKDMLTGEDLPMYSQPIERNDLQEEKQIKEQGNDLLTEKLIEITNKLDDYRTRINKAIEYMKSIEKEPDADMYIEMGEYKEYKHLLNILQGEDKE